MHSNSTIEDILTQEGIETLPHQNPKKVDTLRETALFIILGLGILVPALTATGIVIAQGWSILTISISLACGLPALLNTFTALLLFSPEARNFILLFVILLQCELHPLRALRLSIKHSQKLEAPTSQTY